MVGEEGECLNFRIVTYMGKMTEICKANSGAMLLTDVAAKL